MNITLLSAQDNLIKVSALGKYIAEYYADPERQNMMDIRIYDPDHNTYWEVAPKLNKIDFIRAVNCIWNSQYLFFAACTLLSGDEVEISVYRYNLISRTYQQLYRFYRPQEILKQKNRIKIFILSDSVILIQNEIYHKEIAGNMIGNIQFHLDLIRLDTEEETAVVDSNFLNNGINTITAVSDNKIMVKTGYSWIEDDRMEDSESSGAFIESLYVTTTSKFIADMTIASDTIDMPLIESAYRDRHIVRPAVTGSYTHYILANQETNESKCVFYNHESGERLEYNAGALDTKDIDITYVIHNQPYVRSVSGNEINFLNLKRAEMDISFYDESFLEKQGDLFILQEKGGKEKMHIYTYPGLKRAVSEKRTYRASCRIGYDYYIYC